MKKITEWTLPKTLGGTLIIGGTAIGAGMLALPVVSGLGGFLPAVVIFILCWLFSAATGLLLLEVCQWMPKDANLVTMATQLLGRFGKYSTWLLYIFLFYCLTIAYTAGGGGFFYSLFGGHVPQSLCIPLFSLFFGLFVYMGTRAVDRLNYILMTGLILSYALFIGLGIDKINTLWLSRIDWRYGVLALPVMFTSFSYQGTIPSLNSYLDYDTKKMRKAILFGSAIPFFTYLIWEMLILGLVPVDGPHGLAHAKELGWSAIEPLGRILQKSPITTLSQFFGFFALTTSFLGVTLGLLDFLSDSLEIEKTPKKKLALCALIYLPPIAVVWVNPTIFLKALGYAGGIGCALLLGLMPIAMVWVGRYRRHYSSVHRQLPGGKPLLVLLGLFVIFELIVELLQEILKIT